MVATIVLTLLVAPATAMAQDEVPPVLPPPVSAQVPLANPVGPDTSSQGGRTVRTQECPTTSSEGDLVAEAPWGQTQLNLAAAQQISTGAGQKVAVLDTGVSRHPRLPNLVGLGDYVESGPGGVEGLVDCDAHGTLVAGIIAAVPDGTEQTAFVGVAPDAQVLSIRQSSSVFDFEPPRAPDAKGVGDARTLARAVRLAVDRGATVINISESACASAQSTASLQDSALGAALKYAVEQNVVVVVAAGNISGIDGGACETQNFLEDAPDPDAVVTVATPAWWDEYVLTVGSVDESGAPSGFSLAGPWVDVAAPGEGILSLSPVEGSAGLANLVTTADGRATSIQGTSFAAPYVAGTVALVRAAFPELDARQVMNRIEATAHPPSSGKNPQVGHGVIDPVAAVSDVLPADVSPQQAVGSSRPIAALPPEPAPDTTPRTVAYIGSASALGAVVLTFAVLDAVRRARRRSGTPQGISAAGR